MSDWSSDVCSSDLAGFALFADNMIGFRSDPVVLGTIALLIIVGGLGFPVWAQIGRRPWGPQGWDLHAKLTVSVTVVLLLGAPCSSRGGSGPTPPPSVGSRGSTPPSTASSTASCPAPPASPRSTWAPCAPPRSSSPRC